MISKFWYRIWITRRRARCFARRFPDIRVCARREIPIVAVKVQDVIVDFLLAVPGYEENIIERAMLRDLGGWSAWICAPEDFVVQKMIAGRSKDLADVENILAVQRGQLDCAYIREWLAQFAGALEQPEILTEYERRLRLSKKNR